MFSMLLLYYSSVNDCGEDPPTPDNGVVLTSGTTFGSRARYFCNDGYEVNPSGGDIRTCLANQTWSGVDPTCERKSSFSRVSESLYWNVYVG